MHVLTYVSSHPQSISSSQGYPSVMAPRRKNQPFSKDIPCDGLLGHHDWKSSSLPSDHCLVPVSQGPCGQEYASPRNSTCRGPMDHRTYSNDRSQVRRWAVASATGSQSPTNNSFHLVPGSSHSYDISNSGLTLAHHAMQATVSELSLSNHSRTSDFPYQDIMCTTSAGDTMAMPTCATTFPLEPGFNDYGFSAEENFDCNAWARAEAQSYNIPDSVDMMYSTSADFHQEISVAHSEEPRLHTLWIDEQPLRQEHNHNGAMPYISGQMPLSPLSAVPMDPSVSSYSQNSFYPAYTGSPVSSTAQEELPCLDPTGVADDDYNLSTLKLEGTFRLPMSYQQYELQSDMTK